MGIEKNECGKQQEAGDSSGGCADVQSILERGAEVYGQAEQAVSDAYEKTVQTVSDAYEKTEQTVIDGYEKTSKAVIDGYEKARSYSSKNPGMTIFISLGVGIGLGFLLSTSFRRSPETH